MKIKSGFIKRDVAGKTMVVATGELSKSFKGMITWIVAGLPWDMWHGISNFVCGLLIVPIIQVLRRLEKSIGC